MASCLRRRSRALRTEDRGALAIEAVLIFPLIMMLALGIIEWSLVLRDQVEVTSLARAGARTAAGLAPEHPIDKVTTQFGKQVVDSLVKATSSLQPGEVQSVLVFEANAKGFPGGPASSDMSCASAWSTCNRYDWDPLSGKFVRIAGTWKGDDINSCLGDAGMSVGVYVLAEHKMLSGVFGSTKMLSASTVMRFEPRPPGRCSP